MNLTLDNVGLGEGPGAPLPATSATATTDRPGIAAIETEGAPVYLSLIAGGRMEPETGRVLLDGVDDAARIRERFALVDTPTVAEPFADLTVRTIVQEDLVLAGQKGNRANVRLFLDAIGLLEHEATPLRTLPTEARVRLLTELAILRPGVKGVVLTSPERHGGDTEAWWHVVTDLSARGYTVLVVTGVAAALHLQQFLPVDDGVGTSPETPAVAAPETTESSAK
ncbi:hypothetical protein AX769_02255 [Frondihabitans sp. PAMC 28766]|uniref:hypothetical protein n=1 Tax=Frondihabitans sp. PAMC 28766 TaxID=1795630 RepID=UPI00078E5D5B|nr:hypothetical protein [Frondihabitans sp. PAMC 28766]AMM19167.1 hypothetical protein AX769_02255 [Frondihabitans sp. PAMC 28766]